VWIAVAAALGFVRFDTPQDMDRAQQRLLNAYWMATLLALYFGAGALGDPARVALESLQGKRRREYFWEKLLSVIQCGSTCCLALLATLAAATWDWVLPVLASGRIWAALAAETAAAWLLVSILLWCIARMPLLLWRGGPDFLVVLLAILGMLLRGVVTGLAEIALRSASASIWQRAFWGLAAALLVVGAIVLRSAHRRWCEVDLD
jgi:hypothetical protein